VTPQQYLDQVAADSARFASAAAGNLDRDIEFLDDWSVRDLVAHLGAVYSFIVANTTELSDEVQQAGAEAKAPDGDAIIDWFAERRATLLATLGALDPTADAWTFMGMQPAVFWQRRMTHETGVHRWDIEAAVHGPDAVDPIDPDMATDGIEEYLVFGLRDRGRTYPADSLHLHRTDGPGEWMLAADENGKLLVTHEHGKGDAAVRGSASDLLMWLWGRPVEGVEIFGDQAVADTWQSLAP